eukprot:GHVU01139326.1.p1 GENE.GHVU01139326.1~~GHVU01139326.1.p1  ORF type:complete len:556 (-),score=62.83 GHVU01139326.1:2510-4177(-)
MIDRNSSSRGDSHSSIVVNSHLMQEQQQRQRHNECEDAATTMIPGNCVGSLDVSGDYYVRIITTTVKREYSAKQSGGSIQARSFPSGYYVPLASIVPRSTSTAPPAPPIQAASVGAITLRLAYVAPPPLSPPTLEMIAQEGSTSSSTSKSKLYCSSPLMANAASAGSAAPPSDAPTGGVASNRGRVVSQSPNAPTGPALVTSSSFSSSSSPSSSLSSRWMHWWTSRGSPAMLLFVSEFVRVRGVLDRSMRLFSIMEARLLSQALSNVISGANVVVLEDSRFFHSRYSECSVKLNRMVRGTLMALNSAYPAVCAIFRRMEASREPDHRLWSRPRMRGGVAADECDGGRRRRGTERLLFRAGQGSVVRSGTAAGGAGDGEQPIAQSDSKCASKGNVSSSPFSSTSSSSSSSSSPSSSGERAPVAFVYPTSEELFCRSIMRNTSFSSASKTVENDIEEANGAGAKKTQFVTSPPSSGGLGDGDAAAGVGGSTWRTTCRSVGGPIETMPGPPVLLLTCDDLRVAQAMLHHRRHTAELFVVRCGPEDASTWTLEVRQVDG